jgi:hypothetical protein
MIAGVWTLNRFACTFAGMKFTTSMRAIATTLFIASAMPVRTRELYPLPGDTVGFAFGINHGGPPPSRVLRFVLGFGELLDVFLSKAGSRRACGWSAKRA